MSDAESRYYDALDECRDCHTMSAFNPNADCGNHETDNEDDE